MEVCGGQTHTIIRNGIDQLLPEQVTLIHGPGCPVCVTPLEMIDRALAIAARPGRHLLLVRRHAPRAGIRTRPVPGEERAAATSGSSTRRWTPCASPRRTPTSRSCSSAIGFETTAPANAMAVTMAKQLGLTNFSLLVSHVLVPPAIDRAPGLARYAGCRRFLAAGHVCTVMGMTRVRAARRAVPRAHRRHRVRAARRAAGHPAVRSCSSRRGAPSSRTPTPARCRRGQPCRAAGRGRGVRDVRPSLARHRRDPDVGLAAASGVSRTSTPSSASTSAASTPRSRGLCRSRRGAAGPHQAGRVRRVRHGVHAAIARSARRWSRARARAPRTTSSGGSSRPCRR